DRQHRQRLRTARRRPRDEGDRVRPLRGRRTLQGARRGARDARRAGRALRLRLGPHAPERGDATPDRRGVLSTHEADGDPDQHLAWPRGRRESAGARPCRQAPRRRRPRRVGAGAGRGGQSAAEDGQRHRHVARRIFLVAGRGPGAAAVRRGARAGAHRPASPQRGQPGGLRAGCYTPKAMNEFAAEHDVPIPYMQRTRDYYLALGYGNPYRWAHFADAPFTPLSTPLSRARVALITTAAPFQPGVGDQGPGAPYNAAAKSHQVAWVPPDRAPDLRSSPVGYDRRHTSAKDINTYFPLARMKEAVAAGRIGALTSRLHGAPTNRSHRVTMETDAPE